ncbi:Secreted [Seminavis robusta]|uniref:Secreted n=1 Tax=Seminavis robusta TaxID=568900 RepID=A0A9N8HHQ9_9STRA|nr:Secreted [Seminavis robusta]|eukprot:Sro724_g193200.1 Secreted (323) ;mRNA; r:34908-36080
MFENEYVGLFVLDGSLSTSPDHYHNARTRAIGFNERIDYIIFSCTARNFLDPGSCPVEDMKKCMKDLSDVIAAVIDLGPLSRTNTLEQFIQKLLVDRESAQLICDTAATGDAQGTLNLLQAEIASALVSNWKDSNDGNRSQPTYTPLELGDPTVTLYGNPEYFILNAANQISIQMVRGQDRSGPIYDDDRLVKETMEINERYNGAGSEEPGRQFLTEYLFGYFWPKSSPMPPLGNPFTSGIIAGMLYDPRTPYTWTQEMKVGFPITHLLTSQSTGHTLAASDPDCHRLIEQYFQVGYPTFTDGQVCEFGFADDTDLSYVFTA